jgi:hypothetical protein
MPAVLAALGLLVVVGPTERLAKLLAAEAAVTRDILWHYGGVPP